MLQIKKVGQPTLINICNMDGPFKPGEDVWQGLHRGIDYKKYAEVPGGTTIFLSDLGLTLFFFKTNTFILC